MAKTAIAIEIKNLGEFKRFMDNKSKDYLNKIKGGIGKSALFVEAEVKHSIAGRRVEPKSVDTGRFLNSITTNVSDLSADVSSGVKYGQYLEYGTTAISPRRHFRNTAQRSKEKVHKIFKQEIGR